jgi:LuxR family maltose regulon positive regulatory protein
LKDSLLRTKLYLPPPNPRVVNRPHLFSRMNEGLATGCKLILISAAVGYGKTTLVSDWLSGLNTPSAWLSLDPEDNDPPQFWKYVIAAVQTVQPEIGNTAFNLLQTAQSPPIENLLVDLINQITTLADKIILVIDDYHLIETTEVHKELNFLLDHLPSQLNLVLITREDPPLRLPQLRARRQMIEIRATDLRFTAEETSKFFSETATGLDITADEIAVLQRRTEGWVAGLQLAALSLQNITDKTSFIYDFAGNDRYVVDYLIHEVMEHQPPHIKDFLLKTAFLNRFTASLCDAVTEQNNAIECLIHLQQANLFLISLDNKREWYRYHQLFADLLCYQLKVAVGIEGIKALHQRAADWYAKNGFTDEAIHHYIEIEAFANAAVLMEKVTINLIVQGQLRKVLAWLDSLPEDFLRTRSLLCVCHAWALNLSGQAPAVESRLLDAEEALSIAPQAQQEDILGLIDYIRAFLARRQNHIPLSTEYLRQSAERLSQDNLAIRGAVKLGLGFNYYLSGKLIEAEHTLQEARQDGRTAKAIYTTLIAMAVQANTYVAQGKLNQAVQLFEETIAAGLSFNNSRPFPPAGYACAGLGGVAYEQNDLEKAERLLGEAVELGKLIGDWSIIRRGLLPLAWCKQIQGDSKTAHELWRQALDVVQKAESKRVEANLRVHQARLWLAQATRNANKSALAFAAEWAENYQHQNPDPASYAQALAQRTLAWLRVAQGRAELALAVLDVVAEAAIAGRHTANQIDILTLQGLAHSSLGDTGSALTALKQAFILAVPEGYVRTFVDYGPPMQALLRQAGKMDLFPEYVSKLLAAFTTNAGEDRPTKTLKPSSLRPLVETLTDQEMSILRLMAAGLSHHEIASELYLSINTIKWHTTHIYGKLGVHRRAHAVARARELNII